MIASKLSERLKQTIVIENRAGANTQIAAEYVSKAQPDGYTLFFTTNTSHSANPVLYTTLRYDPIKDFTPIVRTGQVPFILLVNPSLPVKSVAELDRLRQGQPRQAVVRLSGVGGAGFGRDAEGEGRHRDGRRSLFAEARRRSPI